MYATVCTYGEHNFKWVFDEHEDFLFFFSSDELTIWNIVLPFCFCVKARQEHHDMDFLMLSHLYLFVDTFRKPSITWGTWCSLLRKIFESLDPVRDRDYRCVIYAYICETLWFGNFTLSFLWTFHFGGEKQIHASYFFRVLGWCPIFWALRGQVIC